MPACGDRTVLHYEGAAQPLNDRLKGRLVELDGERRRFGYRRLQMLVRREGWRVNHKRAWRLYREAQLHVRRRRKRGPAAIERQPLVRPAAADATWSMDFIFDRVGEANALKVLNIDDSGSNDFDWDILDQFRAHHVRRHIGHLRCSQPPGGLCGTDAGRTTAEPVRDRVKNSGETCTHPSVEDPMWP